jgi:hypothetical protein
VLDNSLFEIAQKNGSSAVAVAAGPSYGFYSLVDRWGFESHGTYVASVQRVTDAPVGFPYSLKVTFSTGQPVFGPDDSCMIYQTIEGIKLSSLQYGTAGAQDIILAFGVKAHRPGTYGGTWKKTLNGGTSLSFGFHYTVNAADTWELKRILIPGVTSGNWLSDNQLSAWLCFGLNAGTNLQVADGAWTAANGSSVSGVGIVNGAAATSDVFQLSPAFIIPGSSVPTSFAALRLLARNQIEEQDRCYRYLRRWAQPPLKGFVFSATLAGRLGCPICPAMRDVPTLAMGGNLPVTDYAGNSTTISSLSTDASTANVVEFNANLTGALTVGSGCAVQQVGGTTPYLELSSEI